MAWNHLVLARADMDMRAMARERAFRAKALRAEDRRARAEEKGSDDACRCAACASQDEEA
jgi:hypothetical protein